MGTFVSIFILVCKVAKLQGYASHIHIEPQHVHAREYNAHAVLQCFYHSKKRSIYDSYLRVIRNYWCLNVLGWFEQGLRFLCLVLRETWTRKNRRRYNTSIMITSSSSLLSSVRFKTCGMPTGQIRTQTKTSRAIVERPRKKWRTLTMGYTIFTNKQTNRQVSIYE